MTRDGWTRFAACAVLLAGAWLRAWGLARGFWLDEIANAGVAANPAVAHVFVVPVVTGRSPLFFAGYPAWLQAAGISEVAARWPAFLCGVLAIALIYACGRKALGAEAGLGAALLLAANPLHAYYSRDASFYTLAVALALASTWTYQGLAGNTRRRVIGYGVCTGLLVATTPWGVWVPLAQAGAELVTRRAARMRGLLAGLALAALVAAPAVALYAQAVADGMRAAPTRPALPGVQTAYTLLTLAWGFAAGPPPDALRQVLETGAATGPLLAAHAGWIALGALGLGVAVWWAWRVGQEGTGAGANPAQTTTVLAGVGAGASPAPTYLWAWLGLALVGTNALATYVGTNFNVRYVLLALPALLLWIARSRRATALALALALVFLAREMLDPAFAPEDLRAPVRFVQDRVAPGDQLVLLAPQSYLVAPLAWYGAEDLPVILINAPEQLPRVSAAAGACRVWLWSARPWLVDPGGAAVQAVAAGRAPAGDWAWPGSTITLYAGTGCAP
jgi:4-amino-4-deoxy-L-arabinose transferase-like glycosyltransferase